MEIRKFEKQDIPALMRIWNEVVDAGQAYPQEEDLTPDNAEEFLRLPELHRRCRG